MLVQLAFLIFVLVLFNKFYHFLIEKPSENVPPGLPRLPIWGSYWFLLWGSYSFPHRTIKYYTEKYKSKVVSLWLGNFFTVIATDYQSIKELLTQKNFDGRITESYVFKARASGKKLVPHRAMEDGELGGFKIPANTVIADLHSMHHDPELWGDPENVRPERFLTEDGRLGKDHSLPFGAGGRLCAGETFARQYLFLASAALAQNFDFSFVDGEPSSLQDRLPGVAVSSKDFWTKVTPRE